MTDIVERLRQGVGLAIQEDVVAAEKIMDEAAAEIERLRERYDFQVAANRSLVEACAKSESENQWRRAAAQAWDTIAKTNQELCDEIERLHAMQQKSPPAETG